MNLQNSQPYMLAATRHQPIWQLPRAAPLWESSDQPNGGEMVALTQTIFVWNETILIAARTVIEENAAIGFAWIFQWKKYLTPFQSELTKI